MVFEMEAAKYDQRNCIGNTFLHFKAGAYGSMRRSHSFAGYISHSQRLAFFHSRVQAQDVEVDSSSVTTPRLSGEQLAVKAERQQSGDSLETYAEFESVRQYSEEFSNEYSNVYSLEIHEPHESRSEYSSSEIEESEYQSHGISTDLTSGYEFGLVPAPAAASGHQQQRMLTQHHHDARPDVHEVHTMMIRNLPRRITQIDLKREIDSDGFKGAYDFLYMPSVIAAKQGKGYAFVNFAKPQDAVRFAEAWHGSRRLKMGRKANLDISAASVQGREANIRSWKKSKTSRIANPSFRPIIFDEDSVSKVTLQAVEQKAVMTLPDVATVQKVASNFQQPMRPSPIFTEDHEDPPAAWPQSCPAGYGFSSLAERNGFVWEQMAKPMNKATVAKQNMYVGGRSMHYESASQSLQMAPRFGGIQASPASALTYCPAISSDVLPVSALVYSSAPTSPVMPWNHGVLRSR